MNFVILKCPLKDNHGLRVSCPWLVSKAQAIDTIRHHTIFLFSIYEPPIILYSSYIKELILLQHILQHRSSNTRTRTRTRTSSNTSSSFLVSSSCSLCSCAVDLGVFGSNLSQVSGFQNSRWRRLASIGVDWRRWRTGRRRTRNIRWFSTPRFFVSRIHFNIRTSSDIEIIQRRLVTAEDLGIG